MSVIHDISPAVGLNPKKKFFAEVGDECLNVDACIELTRRIDTPQAKAVYHAFRRRLAHCRSSMRGQQPEKIREEAWFMCLADLGVKVTMTPINGTMD